MSGVVSVAGRGPAPKDPSLRRRTNKPAEMRPIEVDRAPQPKLPVVYLRAEDGSRVRMSWPAATKQWWQMWADSPLAEEFTANDWSELLDTALIHAQFWNGDARLGPELRLRAAKFGATPEDRQRLKIKFVDRFVPDDAPAGVTSLDDYRDL